MFLRQRQLRYLALAAALSLPCAAQSAAPRPAKSTASAAPQATKVKTGTKRTSRRKAAPKAPEPPPVVEQKPPEPPPPSRLFEMPPVAPQVTYSGGQLTVSASNCTLADILNAVRVHTGTKVEFPSSAVQERVAIQLGPGKPRDVLAKLLLGSPFDYILLGSEVDPDAVTQIMLTRREGGPTAAVAGNRPNQAPPQPEPADEEPAENEPAQQVQPQEAGAPPAQARPQFGSPMQPMPQPPEQNAVSPQPLPGSTPPPGQENQIRTPEQMLRDLQRMQQERSRPTVPK